MSFPALTESERGSAVWQKVRVLLNERLEAHRKKNDGDLDPSATALLRGRIAECKALLDTLEPAPIQTKPPRPESF